MQSSRKENVLQWIVGALCKISVANDPFDISKISVILEVHICFVNNEASQIL